MTHIQRDDTPATSDRVGLPQTKEGQPPSPPAMPPINRDTTPDTSAKTELPQVNRERTAAWRGDRGGAGIITMLGQGRGLLPIPRSDGGHTINGPDHDEMIRRLSGTLVGVAVLGVSGRDLIPPKGCPSRAFEVCAGIRR